MRSRDSIRLSAELFLLGASLWVLTSTLLQWSTVHGLTSQLWDQAHLQVLRRLWHNQNISIALALLVLATALVTRRVRIQAITLTLLVSTFLTASHLMGLIPGKG